MYSQCAKGFRMTVTSMSVIMRIVQNFGGWLREQHEQQFREHWQALRTLSGDTVDQGTVLSAAIISWVIAVNRTKTLGAVDPRMTTSVFDTKFSLLFIPDEKSEYVYGVVDTNKPDWFFRWLEMSNVEDYSYWDADEENHGFVANDWEERKATWERLLGGSVDTSTKGFFTCATSYDSPLTEEFKYRLAVEAAIPPVAMEVREHKDKGGRCNCLVCQAIRSLRGE